MYLDEHAREAHGIDEAETEPPYRADVVRGAQDEGEVVDVHQQDSEQEEEAEDRGPASHRVEDQQVDEHEEGDEDADDGQDSQHDACTCKFVQIHVGLNCNNVHLLHIFSFHQFLY